MKIVLRTFAAIGEALGSRELPVEVPAGERIGPLLERLCEGRPALRGHLFDGSGQPRPHLLILKNGRSLPPEGLFDTVIGEGDVIALFPLLDGG